jgi:hypothetical protein
MEVVRVNRSQRCLPAMGTTEPTRQAGRAAPRARGGQAVRPGLCVGVFPVCGEFAAGGGERCRRTHQPAALWRWHLFYDASYFGAQLPGRAPIHEVWQIRWVMIGRLP